MSDWSYAMLLMFHWYVIIGNIVHLLMHSSFIIVLWCLELTIVVDTTLSGEWIYYLRLKDFIYQVLTRFFIFQIYRMDPQPLLLLRALMH